MHRKTLTACQLSGSILSMEVKKITFRIPKALAAKFKSKLGKKSETAQQVLENAVTEYIK